MSSTRIGYGAKFKIGNGAVGSPAEAFVAVAEIRNPSGPGASRDSADVTHNESPNRHREFLPGIWDGGEVTFEMNFTPANATVLLAERARTTNWNYQLVVPTSPERTWSFSGHMTAYEPDFPTEEGMTASCTFKVSGQPTLA